ncbi:MAG: HAD family phosphatase [Bacteroidota bacterium]
MNNKALLFDMDGVIVDNHKYHFKAWQVFAEKYGFELTEAFYKQQMNGRRMKNCLELVFNRSMTDEEVVSYDHEKEEIYRELYRPELKAHEGLIELLKDAREEGFKLAVATSAPTENVIFTIDGLGIRHFFDSIVDSTQVTQGKPHPEVYLKSAENVETEPSRCIVFEDALRGVEAGKNAGCKVVGVATTHNRSEIVGTDLVIDTFKDLNVDGLNELINKR